MPTDLKYQSEACPRCGAGFVCKANNIGSCACGTIVISKEEQDYIAARFLSCVCTSCLKELKYEYYLEYQHNKPLNYES